jgi:HD superfamily phosphohydrolase
MQRLRNISQTGNTRLVYMFAEHSRFGHSLGVAYLSLLLMKHLKSHHAEEVRHLEAAVAAAALLHDIGHVAPGSHLAEKIWAPGVGGQHEALSIRILKEDLELSALMNEFSPDLLDTVIKILSEDDAIPPWTKSIISGGGWNADRGNWAIVDSTMCSVSYGRYNVTALIDAFRLSANGRLVLQENRLDALTHFFVARDSMYRQV